MSIISFKTPQEITEDNIVVEEPKDQTTKNGGVSTTVSILKWKNNFNQTSEIVLKLPVQLGYGISYSEKYKNYTIGHELKENSQNEEEKNLFDFIEKFDKIISKKVADMCKSEKPLKIKAKTRSILASGNGLRSLYTRPKNPDDDKPILTKPKKLYAKLHKNEDKATNKYFFNAKASTFTGKDTDIENFISSENNIKYGKFILVIKISSIFYEGALKDDVAKIQVTCEHICFKLSPRHDVKSILGNDIETEDNTEDDNHVDIKNQIEKISLIEAVAEADAEDKDKSDSEDEKVPLATPKRKTTTKK